jgi:predicted NBD/HSP70 family sugar kinase
MVESGSPTGPVLAIDIGGTKMAAGVVEPGGRVITWNQVPTPHDLDAEPLWRALEDLLLQVLDAATVSDAASLSGIGCGCGGPMEWPAGVVSPLNIPGWRAFPLKDRLAARFGGGRCGCTTTPSAWPQASTGAALAVAGATCSAWSSRPEWAAD